MKITGIVLAGGLGRRMGGVNKGLLQFQGRPLVAHVIERFAPQVDELLINANSNLETYTAFGYPVITDAIAGFAGPLAGLQSGMSAAQHPFVATVPCDSPHLPVNLVSRLADALKKNGADLAVARTGDQSHPVFCLCRRTLLPGLTTFLENGGRKIDAWYAALNTIDVAFDDIPDAFANINTPEELACQDKAGMIRSKVPLLGFCAYDSGIGKTTLLISLIPLLVQQGLKVSVIKHAHHSFDIDHPGKDSYRLREAGAVQMLLGSRKRWALMTELSRIGADEPEPSLGELLEHLDTTLVDLVVVEGFKHEPIPKIEVCRPSMCKLLLATDDPHVIAVAADGPVPTQLPVLDLNDPVLVAEFVLAWHKRQHAARKIASIR